MTAVEGAHMLPAFRKPLRSKAHEKALYGGSGSGKTFQVQQYALLKGMEEPDAQTLIVMETVPAVMTGMYWPMLKMLEGWKIPCEPRATVPIYIKLPNGHQIFFTGADKVEKFKYFTNPKRVICEEATALTAADADMLDNRMGRTFRDAEFIYMFNPIDANHWIVKRYVEPHLAGTVPDGVYVHHSTYKDNKHLSPEWIAKQERRISTDPNYYRVYVLGLPGHLEGLIYKEGANWQHIPYDTFPEAVRCSPPRSLGLDFGFNDPTSLVGQWEPVDLAMPGTKPHLSIIQLRHLHQYLYASGMTQDDVVRFLEQLYAEKGWPRSTPLYCDSAEPARIEDLRRRGFSAMPAHKDVRFGIDAIKQTPFVVSDESLDLIRELRGYCWQEKEGQVVDKPCEGNDHACDAARYAVASILYVSELPEKPAQFGDFW